MDGNFREDVSNYGNARQIGGATAIETALQKFRHGEDVGAEIKRHKHPAEKQQHQAGQPLKMSRRQARRRSGARQPDKMLRGNIGDKQRGANGEPADVAPSEKILFGIAALFCEIKSDAENDQEINGNDCDIYWRQNPVRDRHRRCEQHPFLLSIQCNPKPAKSVLFVVAPTGPLRRRQRKAEPLRPAAKNVAN